MDPKEFLRSSHKLKKELEFAYKDIDRFFLTSKSTLREELEDIESCSKEIQQKQDLSKRAFFTSIFRVKKQVTEVKNRLETFVSVTKSQGISPDYEANVNYLQKSADLVNAEILQFKEKSRLEFEELAQSQKLLETELDYFAQKFSQWEIEEPKPAKPTVKSIKEEKDLPPLKQELLTIEKEIEDCGGQYLGWDETDHTEFLKVWNKFKGKITPAFLQAAANSLPLHEAEDIKLHLSRFTNFLSLNERKKEVLQKWREEKEKINEPAEVEEKPKKIRPQSAVAARQKIEEWRVSREKAKEEESEKKMQEEERKKDLELRRKIAQEEKRQMILEYKEKKEFEKAKSSLITEYLKKKDKPEITEEDRARMKEREDKLVEQKRRRTLASMKGAEDKEKQDMMLKIKNQAQWAHVDSKLTQDTFAVKARKEAKCDVSENRPLTFGGMVVHRPTRAVPSWRSGL